MVYNIRCGIFLKVNNVKNKVKSFSFTMLYEYYNGLTILYLILTLEQFGIVV